MFITKQMQAGKYSSSKKRAWVPESILQTFINDLIVSRGIESHRVPDSFWAWARSLPAKEQCFLAALFAGRPDNVLFIPISDKYCLAMFSELKTATKKGEPVGKLHGRQKVNARRIPWVISRTPQEIEGNINEFTKFADRLAAFCDRAGSSSTGPGGGSPGGKRAGRVVDENHV